MGRAATKTRAREAWAAACWIVLANVAAGAFYGFGILQPELHIETLDWFEPLSYALGATAGCIFVIGTWIEHESAIPFVLGAIGSLAGFIAYPKLSIGGWRQPRPADADALIQGLAYIPACGLAAFVTSAFVIAAGRKVTGSAKS